MKNMLRFASTLGLGIQLGMAATACADVQVSLVTELSKMEVLNGHLFHDGVLWEAVTREQDSGAYPLKIFDGTTHQLIKEIGLPHNATRIVPYSEHEVLVVGRSSYPFRTHYSVIQRTGDQFTVSTVDFPIEFQVNDVAAGPNTFYFSDVGDAAVYQLSGRSALTAAIQPISGPGPMSFDGKSLWAIELRSIGPSDENVVRYDPKTGTAQRIFGNLRNGLTDIFASPSHPYVAISEALSNQVLLLNKETGELSHTVPVKAQPRGIMQVGGCLVVTSANYGHLSFIRMWETPEIIDTWDFSAAGDRLKSPRAITMNPATGTFFLRSTYMCDTCSTTQSSVFAVSNPESNTLSECLAHP